MNYKKLYQDIINNAKNRIPKENVYTEKHHIKPKCLGGDNSKKNIVRLTAREHYICHKLLSKTFPKNRDLFYGWHRMSVTVNKNYKRHYNISSREYEILRKRCSEFMKGEGNPMFGRNGELNHFYGKKHSDETKLKIGKSSKGRNKGQKRSKEFCDLISKYNKGKKLSDETKLKIGKSSKGRNTGKVWIVNKNNERTLIYKKELSNYPDWKIGMNWL